MVKLKELTEDNLIAPFQVFPSAEWFCAYSGDNKILKLAGLFSTHKTFRGNRFTLPGPNKVATFTIPLSKSSLNGRIEDIRITHEAKWGRELKNALQTLYGKTPYFEYYADEIFPIFETDSLLQLHLNFIDWSHRRLQWNTKVELLEVKAHDNSLHCIATYPQAFDHRFGFVSNVPIFDLIFSLGPESGVFLEKK